MKRDADVGQGSRGHASRFIRHANIQHPHNELIDGSSGSRSTASQDDISRAQLRILRSTPWVLRGEITVDVTRSSELVFMLQKKLDITSDLIVVNRESDRYGRPSTGTRYLQSFQRLAPISGFPANERLVRVVRRSTQEGCNTRVTTSQHNTHEVRLPIHISFNHYEIYGRTRLHSTRP